MKKNLFVSVSLLVIILVVSCASTGKASSGASGGKSAQASYGRKVDSRIPQFVRDAVTNVPEDSLVGIGTAKMASLNQSRTVSSTRARAELSRQMDTIVRDMVRDYTAGSEVDRSAALSFQENITVALSQARLQGSSIVNEDMDDAGNYWTVVMLNKRGTVQEINQAVAAAKLAVPAMASFNAEQRMNEAFDKYVGTAEVGFSNRD
ncbi:MAG: hypothetical protein LBQ93_04960 [Treponema sp.]|jgi:hypothetical protein|nr:hypothetical protein [Treponema sp.]